MYLVAPANAELIIRNMPANVWFEFQKRADVNVLDTETVYVDGEKLVRATFWLS